MAEDRWRKIIFYGDSNTYGYDPADPYDLRFPYEKRWTSIISQNVKGSFQVIPEGMNGRMLPGPPYEKSYLEKLIHLTGEDGILCTMLGTNDILLSTQPDALIPIRKMEQYVSFLKNHLDCSQILVIAPPQIGSSKTPDPLFQSFYRESRKMNDAFRMIATHQDVPFADASEWEIELSFDQVHLSEKGHQTIAERITELIWNTF